MLSSNIILGERRSLDIFEDKEKCRRISVEWEKKTNRFSYIFPFSRTDMMIIIISILVHWSNPSKM